MNSSALGCFDANFPSAGRHGSMGLLTVSRVLSRMGSRFYIRDSLSRVLGHREGLTFDFKIKGGIIYKMYCFLLLKHPYWLNLLSYI